MVTGIPDIYGQASVYFDFEMKVYMKLLAKRIERFFIRNGNWYKILQKRHIFQPNSRNCQNILSIVVAKYVYVLYVLNTLTPHLRKCRSAVGRLETHRLWSRSSICYIKPKKFQCAQEIELHLLGYGSGSLTALFNQFFKEPIGDDRTVPGFKEDSDILMGVRVSAFNLEKVFPIVFRGHNRHQDKMLIKTAKQMKKSSTMLILSLVVSIFRMKPYSAKYFNELLSDQSPLRAQKELAYAFQHWSVELTSFKGKIQSFMETPHYCYDLNYRRRHNIAYQLVTGRLESSGKNYIHRALELLER